MTTMCLAIADYIINKTNEINMEREQEGKERIKMSCKRLQKLIFFSDVEYMKRHRGESFTKDNYYAWPNGPVIPEVYLNYMGFQNGEMIPLGEKYKNLSKEIKKILDNVIAANIEKSTENLIEMTHSVDGPWAKHIDAKEIIPKREIYLYYKKKHDNKNRKKNRKLL